MIDCQHDSVDLIGIWVEGLVVALLVLLALLHLLTTPALFLSFWDDFSLPSLLAGLNWAFFSPALLLWLLLALPPALLLQSWLILLYWLAPSLLILLCWWLAPSGFLNNFLPWPEVLLTRLRWVRLAPALLILLSLLSPAHKICLLDIIIAKWLVLRLKSNEKYFKK